MIPTGFAALAVIGAAVLFYAIGSLVEHHKSQGEIDILTKIIEGRRKEDNH
ncbi:unnamed protein product [marine sediment metagenome]|uniref:Uncharacterized protein n=1 Tax=marine sediment metagenome TaxID=412755 RepID=X1J6K9_9ZZZZ